eukprot:2283389-Pleurochrysis_carterae.AAC.1
MSCNFCKCFLQRDCPWYCKRQGQERCIKEEWGAKCTHVPEIPAIPKRCRRSHSHSAYLAMLESVTGLDDRFGVVLLGAIGASCFAACTISWLVEWQREGEGERGRERGW